MGSQASGAGQRIDKWLWAARFFKTRSLAAEAVSGGKVHLNGQRVKPARSLQVGDELEIRRGEEHFVVVVQGLNEQRRPAVEAQQLYAETPESEARRTQEAEQRRLHRLAQIDAGKRPNKRDRRLRREASGKG